MFPHYPGQYFPRPSRFDRIKFSQGTLWLYVSKTHEEGTYQVLASHLSQSVKTLEQSYRYLNEQLIGILPDLLGAQAITVYPFPQLKLPLAGTLVQQSPVSGYKKLVNIREDLPTLGALSHSLLEDLLAGNNEALFKKIDRLQHSNYPVFSDFFHFLTSDWDVVESIYNQDRGTILPSVSFFKDQNQHFDGSKFEAYFKDEDFLAKCVLQLIRGTFYHQFYSLYGFGLRLILDGRTDVLAYLLNDKLHPFDAAYLKFVLPNTIKVALDGLDDTEDLAYFKWIMFLLAGLNEANFKKQDFSLQSTFYTSLKQTYNFTIVVTGSANLPRAGDRCLIHVFPIKDAESKPESKMIFESAKSFSSLSPYILDHVNPFDYQAANFTLVENDAPKGMFESTLLAPLMGYIIKLLMQAPIGKLLKHQGRLGPILRAIFPGFRIDLLTLPLSESERAAASHLLRAPAQTALYSSLQGYHLGQMIESPTCVIEGLHLYIEGFIDLNKKLQAKGRSLYQGSRDVYTINSFYMNIQPGVEAQLVEVKTVFSLWNRFFGFFAEPHPVYQGMENAPYCHARSVSDGYAFHLTPNTPSVRHSKTGLRFYPIAFKENGLYCHLGHGSKLRKPEEQTTQYIASGCCLLGNDFVATVESSEGRTVFPLLDAHREAPEGTIIDITCSSQEHPEETMYLAIQKTLAPFYSEMYKPKQVIFYYHDLRIDYLMYLLPHYIKGRLSRELLLKGMAMIDERHHLMVEKLTAILSVHHIECRSYSSLNVLTIDKVLNQIDQMKEQSAVEDIDRVMATSILHFLATDTSVSEQVRKVYLYVLSQKEQYQDLLNQQGLHCIAIVNYMAQFAIINQMTKTPLLVALASIEYKLVKNYEQLFSDVFGSIIHFLWMNPINIRDDQRHNRLFFIDQDIPGYCNLIETAAAPIQRITRHQALDNPHHIARELDGLKIKLSSLPHFLAKPKSVATSTANRTESINQPTV